MIGRRAVSGIVVVVVSATMIGGLQGAVLGVVAALLAHRRPPLVFALAVLALAATGVATLVEGNLSPADAAVRSFAPRRPWAAEFGRATGILLLAGLAGSLWRERPSRAPSGPRNRVVAEPLGVLPLAFGLVVAVISVVTVGDATFASWGPMVGAVAGAFVVARSVGRRSRSKARS